jgi:hypothetical protein
MLGGPAEPAPALEDLMNGKTEDKTRLRGMRIIAVSALVDLVILLAAAEFMRARLKPFMGFAARQNLQPVRYAVFGLAALTILIIRIIKSRLSTGTACDRGEAYSGRLPRANAVIMALAVVPALLGFLLFLLYGLNVDLYLLLFASACLIFIFFPREAAGTGQTDV